MKREIFERFKGQKVKIAKDDNFIIWGCIIDVFDDSLLFKSDDKTIYLTFDRIKEIMPKGNTSNRRINY